MKRLTVTQRGTRLLLAGYPASAAIRKLPDADAKELRVLALHQAEVNFCCEALKQFLELDLEKQPIVARSLWLAALESYYRCFGTDKARTLLSPKKVLKPFPGAQEVFEMYMKLHEQHRVPLENPYVQAVIGIVINPAKEEKSIADVVSVSGTALVIEKKHAKQLLQLATVTLARIEEQRQLFREAILKKFTAKDHKSLLALDELSFPTPAV